MARLLWRFCRVTSSGRILEYGGGRVRVERVSDVEKGCEGVEGDNGEGVSVGGVSEVEECGRVSGR